MTQEYHNVYKAVRTRKFNHLNHSRARERISATTRVDSFLTVYPVNKWIEIKVGVSFVFVSEEAARQFIGCHDTVPMELWKCETDAPPLRLYGMAGHWRDIPAFWRAEAEGDLSTLSRISVPCPESFYGVKKLKLFTKLD